MDPAIIGAIVSAAGAMAAAAMAIRARRMRKLRPQQWIGAVATGAVFLAGFAATAAVAAYRGLGAPRISITEVPPADAGEGGTLERIGGVVRGRVEAGARVVVYAYSDGHWFVQPGGGAGSLTPIEDRAWTATTHTGTKYAALLVAPGFDPPTAALSLPSDGGVLASTEVAGRWGER